MRWTTLAVVSAATAMLLLDVTVVNVALPAIRADLDASFAELQWVIDAYALTLAATLLTAGAVALRPLRTSAKITSSRPSVATTSAKRCAGLARWVSEMLTAARENIALAAIAPDTQPATCAGT